MRTIKFFALFIIFTSTTACSTTASSRGGVTRDILYQAYQVERTGKQVARTITGMRELMPQERCFFFQNGEGELHLELIMPGVIPPQIIEPGNIEMIAVRRPALSTERTVNADVALRFFLVQENRPYYVSQGGHSIRARFGRNTGRVGCEGLIVTAERGLRVHRVR